MALLMTRLSPVLCAPLLFLSLGGHSAGAELEFIRVSDDGESFVTAESGEVFTPWGFNYDHDESDKGRLIEDYWEDEWPKIEEDFREMRELGANVVRIHLQFGTFMLSPEKPNEKSLRQLDRLIRLAEKERLYLDLTGLGCYHKQDVPEWYDKLDETSRWDAQAKFWEAVAARGDGSPAVFCYDLMNEPVVPAGKKRTDWLGPGFAGKHFVQFIGLDIAGRDRPAVARNWIKHLSAAIRKHDKRHLITVGLVPWSLKRPGRLQSGFEPARVADEVDFIAVHIYPERGKLDEAIETLRGFDVGKPVVIEETFPLKCSPEELGRFIDRSEKIASGWIGFYWGRTPEEYRRSGTLRAALVLGWLEYFQKRAAARGF